MLILGLTGQSGSGKSTLAEKLVSEGFVHLDCDKGNSTYSIITSF